MKLNRYHKIVLAALVAAQNFLAVADTTNTLAPSGYPKFIADRNIFNPYRLPGRPYVPRPPRPPQPTPPRTPDSFSLVGVIGYGEGQLAGVHVFFDGSSSLYQKEAELNGSIANFKVAGISPDSVTLVAGTNKMVLEMGEQLHDDTSGHWFLANGETPRYNDTGGNRNRYGNDNSYGNGRNSGGGGGRRRGGGGNGGYNNGNNGYGNNNNGNGRNFNRGRNNYNNDSSAATSDNSQAQDENATPSGGMGIPILTPDGFGKMTPNGIVMTPDGIVMPDGTTVPVQNNTMAPDNSGNPDDTTPQDNNQ